MLDRGNTPLCLIRCNSDSGEMDTWLVGSRGGPVKKHITSFHINTNYFGLFDNKISAFALIRGQLEVE